MFVKKTNKCARRWSWRSCTQLAGMLRGRCCFKLTRRSVTNWGPNVLLHIFLQNQSMPNQARTYSTYSICKTEPVSHCHLPFDDPFHSDQGSEKWKSGGLWKPLFTASRGHWFQQGQRSQTDHQIWLCIGDWDICQRLRTVWQMLAQKLAFKHSLNELCTILFSYCSFPFDRITSWGRSQQESGQWADMGGALWTTMTTWNITRQHWNRQDGFLRRRQVCDSDLLHFQFTPCYYHGPCLIIPLQSSLRLILIFRVLLIFTAWFCGLRSEVEWRSARPSSSQGFRCGRVS